jgi:hypothetical protein
MTLMTLKQTIIYKLLRRKLKIEQHEPRNKPEANSCTPEGTVPMASKRNDARRNKTALSSREQAKTSIKMEGLRSNTTIVKFS